MSTRNAGTTIRDARLKAGLTQEQLSEGVCSVLSLSRIENGSSGISPSTFQALMAHAGAPMEVFPAFANRADFDCFYSLKRVHFYLDSWQLTAAYDELEKIELMNWADNKFYYQEWLFAHCRLQIRSGMGDHAQIYDVLLDALRITRPDFNTFDFRSLLLSVTEIRILTALAWESLSLNKTDLCGNICEQLSSYLANCSLAFLEKESLSAELAVVQTRYYLEIADNSLALTTADTYRIKAADSKEDAYLLELTFMTGLCHQAAGDDETALTFYKTAFYAAHSIGSCYATICKTYLADTLGLELPIDVTLFPDIPLIPYKKRQACKSLSLGDGSYSMFSPDALSIGGLIRELRTEKKISQTELCLGLCSKSKLSKIENGTLQPDVLLSETLLQRLGISPDYFTFFGGTHEATLHELHMRLVHTPSINEHASYEELLVQMESLIPAKNTLYQQLFLLGKARLFAPGKEQAELLLQILNMTIPDFQIEHLSSYRLSWLELTVLNKLGIAYANYDIVTGIQYLYQILNYQLHSDYDILLLKRIYPVTISWLVRKLYVEKRYTEALSLADALFAPAMKGSIYFNAAAYAHHCQSLGECAKYEDATRFFHYAYYDSVISGVEQTITPIVNDVFHDFGIQLS